MTIERLPKFELYEEGSQIRRSSKSIVTNIVEGFGRRRYKAEFVQFLTYSLASCNETREHLDLLFETGSLKDEKLYNEFVEKCEELGRKITKFIQAVEKKHLGPSRVIKNQTSSIILSLLFLLISNIQHPISIFAAGTTSATFLKLGVGARPVAMGGAFTGIADDVNSVVWNPAGLINIEQKEFSFMHLEHFQEIRYNSLVYAQPVSDSVLGFGFGYLFTDDIKRTFIDDNQYGFKYDGSYKMEDKTFFAAGSRKIEDDKSVGILVRWLSEKIENHEARGFAFDIGYLHLLTNNLLYGLSVQNIGSSLKFIATQENLPVIFRGGVGIILFDEKLKLALDLVQPIDYQLSVNLGGECKVVDFLTLRAGWRFKSLFRDDYLGAISGISAGVGFNFYNYSLDYAFVPYGDLGYSHRISLGGRF